MLPEMSLVRFRVRNFRSVEDSGWIDVDSVTALIGTNESGKSNLLLPLWKLNPAKGGEIHPTADFPRKHFTAFRSEPTKPVFVEAEFAVQGGLRTQLAVASSLPEATVERIMVRRRLDGSFEIDFPLYEQARTVAGEVVASLLESAQTEIASITPMKSEVDLASSVLESISSAVRTFPHEEGCDHGCIARVLSVLSAPDLDGAPKTSSIVPRFERLREDLEAHHVELLNPHPRDVASVKSLVVGSLPKFVYYSNYGNLDSEIYLPHVIQNLKREESLGQRERAKARTLKVLFEFVKLQPVEILELGKENYPQGQTPTETQVEYVAERKKERSILLQSASARLTEVFREWWRQGDYRFRFEADGDHFRIWVADDRRPEEIELEGRSTGLQWFLSFYLVFLVESRDTHSGCILLLDEPGLSLHPLAQRDLSDFFDGLAQHNQLLYTTHSPFLVDADRLDRARKVYVAPDGTSKATSDLGADGGDPTKRGAGYAVHAALGLSVAEGLLIGCEPVVVEGPSDQHYLTTIKAILARQGVFRCARELVFPPAGGAKGVKAVASVLGGRNAMLPTVLLDSDAQGLRFGQDLRAGLYAHDVGRVLQVGAFIEIEGAEVEDLIPPEIFVKMVDRMVRPPDVCFEDVYVPRRPVVPQVENWASRGGIALEKGWKVELSKRVKRALLDGDGVSDATLVRWRGLFDAFGAGRVRD
jgi:energy-coupling factor transporter ATP-binding protein EcfA2